VRGRGTGGGGRPRRHGASAAHALLQAGRLDEMGIHLVPVLLGAGRRLFEDRTDRVELELVRRLDGRGVTHLRHRVRR
jgi:dihydrofolate reductase